MTYSVIYTKQAEKQIDKLNPTVRNTVLKWINRNLNGCENPRRYGKALNGEYSGDWRYRVGDYRILSTISDDTVTILVFKIGHRKNVYE